MIFFKVFNKKMSGVEIPHQKWYMSGSFHHTDFPEIQYRKWYDYASGILRTDGPAIEIPMPHQKWYMSGSLYHTDGPAIDIDMDQLTFEMKLKSFKLKYKEIHRIRAQKKDILLDHTEIVQT